MIKSMTAFSRSESNTSIGHLVWEIRAVNHRYLEIHFRLPEELRPLEPLFRERIRKQVSRGKLEISGKLKLGNSQQSNITLNEPLIEQLIIASEHIRKLTKHASEINPTDILNWPNVLLAAEPDIDSLSKDALTLFSETLDQLVTERVREGSALKTFISEKTDGIGDFLGTIEGHLPQIIAQYREKIETKIAELKINIDPERLEQELLLIAQKSDVKEELDRLSAHCDAVKSTLETSKPIGRRLDFLLQEMNREINTVGSKISESTITQQVVEIKVLIEQIREQIQNIE